MYLFLFIALAFFSLFFLFVMRSFGLRSVPFWFALSFSVLSLCFPCVLSSFDFRVLNFSSLFVSSSWLSTFLFALFCLSLLRFSVASVFSVQRLVSLSFSSPLCVWPACVEPFGAPILKGYVVSDDSRGPLSTQVRYTLYSVIPRALKRPVTSHKNGEPGRP